MKKIKENIKLIIGFILGLVIAVVISTYAATQLASSSVYYDNSTSGGSSNTVSGAIDELYDLAKTTEFKVGDYVSMTPEKTSFNIPKTLTGYENDQTINPSELNLWRVIKINDDATVDMVSEYVSSIDIYFTGQTGYQNLIGTLNYIAKQYENKKYTSGSRHMGYGGQTEYITDVSKFTYPAPWTSTTSDNSNESLGGGDILHRIDELLILSAIGKLIAKNLNGTVTAYWEASRFYFYWAETNYDWSGRVISVDGYSSRLYNDNFYDYYGGFKEYSEGHSIRPIVTLKSGVKASSGDGSSDSPYMLE